MVVAAILVPKIMRKQIIEKKDAFAAQMINDLYRVLDEVSAEVKDAPVTDMGNICAKAKDAADAVDALPTDYESEMSAFVKSLQGNSAYIHFKDQYITGLTFSKVGTDSFSLSLSFGYAAITQKLISAIEVQRPKICSEYQ